MMSQHWHFFKDLASFFLQNWFETYKHMVIRVHSDLTIRTLVPPLAVVLNALAKGSRLGTRLLGVLIPYLVCKTRVEVLQGCALRGRRSVVLTLRFVNATCLGISFVSWQAVGAMDSLHCGCVAVHLSW